METLDLYGVCTLGLISLLFVFVRSIPLYAIACPVVIAAFSLLSRSVASFPVWGLWIVGLILSAFGLLIVRVMLIRSVSLQLLRRIASGGAAEGMGEDIGARLADMDYFHLVRRGELNRLTPFGWFCSSVVVLFYVVFRIK